MARRARGYAAVEHQGFGLGLNLRDGPDVVEAGFAIDALNTRFSERGVLDVRPGFNHSRDVAVGASAYPSHAMGFQQAGEWRTLICAGANAYVSGPSLAETGAAASALTGGQWSSVRIGSPNTEHVYCTNGDFVRRWTGSAWETCDGGGGRPHLGKPSLLGVTSEGRLMLGGFTASSSLPPSIDAGIDADPALICISNPGDPTTYEASAFVRLRPGDGEKIMAIVTWRELTFVFKESGYFVFAGTSIDPDGLPVFHRRAVDTGVGLASRSAICVGRDGVYFLGKGGIYLTQGGPPQLLSDLVEPILTGRSARYYLGGNLNAAALSTVRLCWHDEKLYVTFPAGSSTVPDRQLVYDGRFGWWTLYDLPAGALTVLNGELVFPDSEQILTNYALWRHREEATSDAEGSSAIRSFLARWRSGWFNFDDPTVKTLAELKIWAVGTIGIKLSRDFQASFEYSGVVQLGAGVETWGGGSLADEWGGGSDPDIWAISQDHDDALVRRAIRGTHFSFQLEGQVGQVAVDDHRPRWSVHRVAHHLRETRHPSTLRADR